MNCQGFENVVNDLARVELIEAVLREEALQHSDQCSACAARLSEERSLSMNLRALVGEMNSLGASERVESPCWRRLMNRDVRQRTPTWELFGRADAAVL